MSNNAISKTSKMALLLNAHYYQLSKPSSDGSFWGSEEAVEMQNTCARLSSKFAGVDVTEDSEWISYTKKATDHEIAGYTINKLIELDPLLSTMSKNGGRLYAVALEGENLTDEWREILNKPFAVDLWTEENLTEDMGWSKRQSQELLDLNVGEMVNQYGDFRHTIFRIK